MIEFRVLGPLEVRDSGQRVRVGGPKHRRILAALALEPGRVVPVERLVDAIWDDEPPPTARRQVQNAVSALRQTVIGSVLFAEGPGYVLRVSPDQVDAQRFDAYVARAGRGRAERDLDAAADALRAALALWRGPALAGVGGRVGAEAAALLEERRLSAVAQWAQVALDLGLQSTVVDELVAVVDQHPLREPLAGLLMLALHRCSRTAEAVVRYHRVRHALVEELGIEPGPELRNLYEAILVADPAIEHQTIAPAGRNDLPRDIAYFTGRSAELERLMSLVDCGGTSLIGAIDGMAGIGKTALAVHAAHLLADRFPDGQLFVDLHGHTADREPLTADAALDMLLRAAGVPDESIPKDNDEKAAHWRAELARRRVLVVLDNAYNLVQVRPLIPNSPVSAVLITSRRRLVGLVGAEALSLDVMPEADAVALFDRIGGHDRLREQTSKVAEVVRLCGYLPLAIGIVAARLRTRPPWTVEHIARRLRDRPALLEVDDYGVAAAFAVSYQHLPPDQQRMFRLLGLHPGMDIDIYAAAAIAGLSLDRAEQLLEALCDAHLLGQLLPGRYRLHDLVRAYAHASADSDEPELAQTRARHHLLDYYLYVSEIAADLVSPQRRGLGPGPEHPPADIPVMSQLSDARSWFEAESGNLPAIVRTAAEHSTRQHGWQIPRNVAAYLWRYGYFRVGARLIEDALAACGADTDPVVRTILLLNLAQMHQVLGDYLSALECLRRSETNARTSGDRLGTATSLAQMAELCNHLGRFTDAVAYSSRSIATYRESGAWRREAETSCIHSDALVRLGRHREALDSLRHTAIAGDGPADERVVGVLLSRMGTAHSYLGDHDVAIDTLTRCVQMTRDTKDRPSEAAYLHRLAQACRRAGRYAEALSHAHDALDLLRDVEDPADLSETHNALGAVHHGLGRYDDALRHYRQAQGTAAEFGYRIGQALALDGIGHALHALGEPDRARQHWRQALDTFIELGVPEANTVRERLGSQPPSPSRPSK